MISKYKVIFSIYAFVCILGFSACQPQPDNVPGEIKDWNDLVRLSTDLSPDGNWLARIPFGEDSSVMELYSMKKTTEKISLQTNPEGGKYQQISAWSPDSTMIAVVGANSRGKCAYDTVALYKLNKSFQIDSFTYQLSQNDLGCLAVAWSPDNNYLAIYNGAADKVYIVNRKANPVATFDLKMDGMRISVPQIVWTETGLYATVLRSSSQGKLVMAELQMYSPPGNVGFTSVYESNVLFKVLGFGPKSKEVALARFEGNYPYPSSTLLIIDLSTSQVVRQIPLDFTPAISASSPDGNYIGLVSGNKPETENLFVYDWEKATITDYGSITHFIGWKSKEDGFLIVQGDEKHYVFSVIQPHGR